MAPEAEPEPEGDAERDTEIEAEGEAEGEVKERAQPPGCKQRLQIALCVIWAATVGISVPLEMVNTIFLNSHADKADRKYHAFYVSNLAVAMGGLELIPLSIRASKPISKPKRWWHLAGGLGSLPAFFTISGGAMLGTQVVLVVQLAALLTSFFIIDLVDGRLILSEYSKVVALLVIFIGVALDSGGYSKGISGGLWAVLMLPLVALTGIGYAMQSKCNNALAEDLGSSSRATMASACVFLICSIPIDLYIYFSLDVSVSLDKGYWYLWLVAGFQSAFYIGSMAYLPRILGFTSCYVITLVAKLSTSLFIDSKGLSGEVVPVTVSRVIALITVLLGSLLFNFPTKNDDFRQLQISSQPSTDETLDVAETAEGVSLPRNAEGI